MTSLRIKEVANRSFDKLPGEKEAKPQRGIQPGRTAGPATVKAEVAKHQSAGNSLLQGSNVIQGMVWHEIFSEPLCKRRRNK